MRSSFSHAGITMAYRTYGEGDEHMVAIHGFARDGADFAILQPQLKALCTVHAFDLPFHGGSPSPHERTGLPYRPDELPAYFSAFADHIAQERVIIMGYSLGGRIGLNMLEHIPERISRALLLAPDGLAHRPWYRGLAASRSGRALYRHFIHHPGAIHTLIHALARTGSVNARMQRFLMGRTDSIEKRQLVNDVWLCFREIEPDLGQVAANVRKWKIPVQLVFGARDQVIKPTYAAYLQPKAPELISTYLMDAGHALLTPQFATWLAAQPLS